MQGLIHVSQPVVCKKNQSISIDSNQKKLICILNGKLKAKGHILISGDVYGLEYLTQRHGKANLIALEETRVIFIEGKDLDFLKKERQNILNNILSSTVNYISEMKEHLN